MLTKLTVRNFKRFGEVEIELGSPVLFIGPNNSGKTTAMQALALWDIGLRRWNEKRAGRRTPEQRPGVTVNRRDLLAIPVPDAKALWRQLHIRDVRFESGRQLTSNIRIEILVEGETGGRAWKCGLEFDYANEESFYCRPLRLEGGRSPERMKVPEDAAGTRIALLPPMSGLAATEIRLDPGAIDVRIGEGRTAEVLRNLCHQVYERREAEWERLIDRIRRLFGAQLEAPRYIAERGEIIMTYKEGDTSLDLSAAGRGLQQTLLLLAYMYVHPGDVLLLDEPDAHLEILRQRQIYRQISDVARENGSQIIAASHSEILLNEAAGKDHVIAFVGSPHRIDRRSTAVRNALAEIGWEHYYQAEQTGWVLYLEGSTDLAILQSFAGRLGHTAAQRALERPFVHYVGNDTTRVQRHFRDLREAVPHLQAVALFDRLEGNMPAFPQIDFQVWRQREIENYLCTQATLEAYALASAQLDPPQPRQETGRIENLHRGCRIGLADTKSAPWRGARQSQRRVLTPIFRAYHERRRVQRHVGAARRVHLTTRSPKWLRSSTRSRRC